MDEIIDRLLRDIGPGWLFAALVAIIGTILGLVAIVSPYIAGAGAILSGIAAIVRAWRAPLSHRARRTRRRRGPRTAAAGARRRSGAVRRAHRRLAHVHERAIRAIETALEGAK